MLTHSQKQEALDELCKVLQMASQGIEVQIFSQSIDSVWHKLLESKDEYSVFSITACGSVIGHRENYESGIVNFIESYERRWGELPDIWFTDEDGHFDINAHNEYFETGLIQASWNCQATHNCMDVYKNDPRPNRSKNPSPDKGKQKKPHQNPANTTPPPSSN